MCFNPSPVRRVPSPNRYMAVARFCFCKNNKRTIDRICCLPAGVQDRRVPGRKPAGPNSSVQPIGGPRGVRQYPIEHACLRQYPIEQDFRGRDAHGCVRAHSCCELKTLKTVPYRFNAVRSLAGRSRVVEAQSERISFHL
jgi:hypothetical protein